MSQSTGKTGTKDDIFDLVSVLYHCLDGAKACDEYIHDAQQTGDNESVKFFQDCKQQNIQLADRCKQILSSRMSSSMGSMGQRRAA